MNMHLAELTEEMNRFVGSKGWYDPNSPRPQSSRNLATALVVEAAEVLELYEWDGDPGESALAEELADVALYTLQLASRNDIDLEEAIVAKLRSNYGREWPVE